jgi:hypothetical protein
MSKLKVNQVSKTTAGAATFTLPATDGTTDQYLKTDGSGALSFGTPTDNDTGMKQISKSGAYTITSADMADCWHLHVYCESGTSGSYNIDLPPYADLQGKFVTIYLAVQEGGDVAVKHNNGTTTLTQYVTWEDRGEVTGLNYLGDFITVTATPYSETPSDSPTYVTVAAFGCGAGGP